MWQVIYDELKDRNFEIIAVALDTSGKTAVEPHIRPTNLDERPEAARRITGWGESEWSRKAPPQYPCLIDEEHVVAGLYGMINVPSAVWIDEEGRIVRPVEVPGFGDDWRFMHRETFELPDDKAARQQVYRRVYVDALRDWAHKGEDSEYALPADEVRRRLQPPAEDDVLAATHVRLGRLLYREGHLEAAKRHLQEAVRLSQGRWNYLRQGLSLDPELVGQINVTPEFWEVFDAIGDATYYEAADLPGMPR